MQAPSTANPANTMRRGRSHSAKTATVAVASDIAQYLTFSLGKELFAASILVIKEILQYGELTEVPLMPAYLRGVINLRGAVVPVIDLAQRLGKACSVQNKRTCIVIIEIKIDDKVLDVGLMVDAVSAVIDISASQIEAAPALGGMVRTDFIAGMGKLESGFVIILNVARIFSSTELDGLVATQATGQV